MQHQNAIKPTKGQQQLHQSQSCTRNRTDVILSQNKIRAIMKSSPEVEHVGNESLFLIAKATELFVDHLTTKTIQNPKGMKSYEYKSLAEVVQGEDNLEFLKEIIPLKITARVALQEVAKYQALMDKI